MIFNFAEENFIPAGELPWDNTVSVFYNGLNTFNAGNHEGGDFKNFMDYELDERDHYNYGLFLFHSGRFTEAIIWLSWGIINDELIYKIIVGEDITNEIESGDKYKLQYLNNYREVSREYWTEKSKTLLRYIYYNETFRDYCDTVYDLKKDLSAYNINYELDEHDDTIIDYINRINDVLSCIDKEYAFDILKGIGVELITN